MKAQLTFIHTLSALHAGVGQGAGVIDLPIARRGKSHRHPLSTGIIAQRNDPDT